MQGNKKKKEAEKNKQAKIVREMNKANKTYKALKANMDGLEEHN